MGLGHTCNQPFCTADELRVTVQRWLGLNRQAVRGHHHGDMLWQKLLKMMTPQKKQKVKARVWSRCLPCDGWFVASSSSLFFCFPPEKKVKTNLHFMGALWQEPFCVLNSSVPPHPKAKEEKKKKVECSQFHCFFFSFFSYQNKNFICMKQNILCPFTKINSDTFLKSSYKESKK